MEPPLKLIPGHLHHLILQFPGPSRRARHGKSIETRFPVEVSLEVFWGHIHEILGCFVSVLPLI